MAHNWTESGIVWRTEEVARQRGPNRSDRQVLGEAWMPTVVDVDKFIKSFGGNAVVSMLNGTSLRVKIQDVNRRALEKKLGRDWIETTTLNLLRGLRNAPTGGGVRVVVKVQLPDGTMYEGDDESDFQAAFAAALVDLGVDADKALATAAGKKLPEK